MFEMFSRLKVHPKCLKSWSRIRIFSNHAMSCQCSNSENSQEKNLNLLFPERYLEFENQKVTLQDLIPTL